jgi:hypothetical protein
MMTSSRRDKSPSANAHGMRGRPFYALCKNGMGKLDNEVRCIYQIVTISRAFKANTAE